MKSTREPSPLRLAILNDARTRFAIDKGVIEAELIARGREEYEDNMWTRTREISAGESAWVNVAELARFERENGIFK